MTGQIHITCEQDNRPPVAVFLASGQEFKSERQNFEALIKRLGNLPNIARNYKLIPVHWQQGGGDTDGRTLQEKILESTHMEDVPIIVVLVGTYIGSGTLEEYETAISLREVQGSWPEIWVFFKCRTDGVTLIGDSKVFEFHKRVLSDNITVPIHFRNESEYESKLEKELVEGLPVPKIDPVKGEILRKRFYLVGMIAFAVSLIAIFYSSIMRFPDNASWTGVLIIIISSPIAFLLGITTLWYLYRLIEEFHYAWNSVNYSDARMFDVFKNLIPTPLVPDPLRKKFPKSRIGVALNSLLLFLILCTPLAAQFVCTFNEMINKWDYVIDPDELVSSPKPEDSSKNNPVHSRYVECHPLKWPYSLKTPEVRNRYKNQVIYVYAEGKLDSKEKFGTPDAFRENIGPEVFLPWQPLIYIGMLVLQTVLTFWLLAKLLLLSKEARQGRKYFKRIMPNE